jgi:WD40 repeat protein
MNATKNQFQCLICEKILMKPRLFPCSCEINVCNQHLSTVNKSISCLKCNKIFDLSLDREKFKENLSLKAQIESDIHLNEEFKAIKCKLTLIINEYNNCTNKLKCKCDEFSILQADYFENIRREIDIRRETLTHDIMNKNEIMNKYLPFDFIDADGKRKMLTKINRQSIKLIDQVEKHEEEFRKNFIQNLKIQLINDENLKLDELFQDLNNDLAFFEKLFLDYELKVKQLDKRLNNFKLLEYDLKQNRYYCSSNTPVLEFHQCADLGSLLLEKNFIMNANTLDDPILNLIVLTEHSNEINVLNVNKNIICGTFQGDVDTEITCLELYDENKIIFGQINGLIKVWNLTNTTECVKTLQGHYGSIKTIKVLSNNQLASGSAKVIKIWNLLSGDCMLTLMVFFRGNQGLRCLDQLPNGNLININVERYHLIRIWDLDKGECIKELKGHFNYIRCVKVLNKNDWFATGSSDETIKIWSCDSSETCLNAWEGSHCLETLRGSRGRVEKLELTSDCKRLISLSINLENDDLNTSIRVWDLEKFECIQELGMDQDYCSVRYNDVSIAIIIDNWSKSHILTSLKKGIFLISRI